MGERDSGVEKPTQPNCLGFVLHHFGIIRKEVFVEPWDWDWRDLQPWFVVTDNNETADAVVFTKLYSNQMGSVGLLYHIAIIDPQDRNFVIHREELGASITRQSLTDVLSTYPLNQSFNMIYLKRCPTADC